PMATKKETTAEQTAESTMPTQEEMQKLLEENARLKAERDAAEAARIDAELAAAQSKETEQLKEDEELTAGQKQVQMEKRMQEAMEAAKAEKETIRLPITGNGDDDVFVSVNGYKYLIQRGKEVEVPRFVAEVLRNSENQKAATYRMMEEMQKKAEDGTGQFL
ncbi:MAG: hypothetical protein ACLUPD_10865, partial [Anaerotignum faecicola]